MRACAIALGSALLALAAHDAAAINKCVDKAGKVTYQEGRCPDDAKQDALKLLGTGSGPSDADSAPPKAGAAPSKADPVALVDDPENPQLRGLASTQSTFEACSAASPDFAGLHAADYEAWRAANAALLAKAERLPSYQRLLANGREQLRTQPANLEQFARFCAVQFIPMMRKNTGK